MGVKKSLIRKVGTRTVATIVTVVRVRVDGTISRSVLRQTVYLVGKCETCTTQGPDSAIITVPE